MRPNKQTKSTDTHRHTRTQNTYIPIYIHTCTHTYIHTLGRRQAPPALLHTAKIHAATL